MRCELAIALMSKCRDANVFPKFTRWKNANAKPIKDRNKYRRKVLLDEVRTKHTQLRQMKEEVKVGSAKLYTNMTYMKKWTVTKSIQNINDAEKILVQKRHNKKLANLLDEKAKLEGTMSNPN